MWRLNLLRARLSALLRPAQADAEMSREMAAHLAMLEEEFRRRGLSEQEAKIAARRKFGPLERAHNLHREARSFVWLEQLGQDLLYSLRTLATSKAYTAVAIVTLAVTIGANTAIFSVVEGVLLSPLPYPDESRIVRVGATSYGSPDSASSYSDAGYWHFVNNNRSFENFGAYRVLDGASTLTGGGRPVPVLPSGMTLSAFEALGVPPELGRLPTPQEDAPGGPLVALISHDLWVSRYGADPSVLGRTINLFGLTWEVIGVMPADYGFPTPEHDIWLPLQLNPASQNYGGHYLRAIGRLAPGVTVTAAIDDARSLIARYGEVGYGPSWFEDIFDGGAIVRPLRDEIVGDARLPLLIVLGTVGFVLLIACSNVANLLLVRAEGRRQENAVRMALGASRARLARHLLIESGLIALMGGAAGLLLAQAGTRALISMGPAGIPRLDEIGIDGAALAFTAIVSVLAGLLFGMLPAVRSSAARTMAALHDGGRSATSGRDRHRTPNALVTTQVALAFVLVVGAGLMVRSFEALRSVDPGFSAVNVLTFQVSPLSTKYEDPVAVAQFYDRLTERLQAVPGVVRAGAIDTLPLTGGGDGFLMVIEEFPPSEDELAPSFMTRRAAPGYFEAMSIPLIEGRTFTRDDHDRLLPSVIISESIKSRYWPDTSALGKRITFGDTSLEVVGVVGDVHDESLYVSPEHFVYLPIVTTARGGVRAMTMTVRTAVEPLSVVGATRNAIAELDDALPITEVQSMEQVLGDSTSRTSFTMSLLSVGAVIALFLGSVGIYGVLSYVVSQRTPEIGIRSALGASPDDMRRMVLSQGMRLVVAGVLIGLVVAVGLGRVVQAQLYEVSPFDPVTFIAASAIFLAVAAVASFLPAARAAGTAPLEALRVG